VEVRQDATAKAKIEFSHARLGAVMGELLCRQGAAALERLADPITRGASDLRVARYK